jgi:hypothetical protein
MTNRFLKLVAVTGLLVVSPLSMSEAQRGDRGDRPNRAQLEQRFRQRLANLLKTQLGLTDDEMRQLSEVNQRFEVQRRDVQRREMMTRRGLRDEVLKRDSANAGRIEQLMADQFKLDRERIDLTEAEQRELSRFLTPVQRARYLGVQEQLRREMDQLRGRRGMSSGGDSADRRRRPPD